MTLGYDSMLSLIKKEDVIDRFHFYYHLNTSRAKDAWDRIQKVDKLCSQWMHKDDVWQLKVELFVQEMEGGYIEEELTKSDINNEV